MEGTDSKFLQATLCILVTQSWTIGDEIAGLDVMYFSSYGSGSHLAFVQLDGVLKIDTRTCLGYLADLMSVKELTPDGNESHLG